MNKIILAVISLIIMGLFIILPVVSAERIEYYETSDTWVASVEINDDQYDDDNPLMKYDPSNHDLVYYIDNGTFLTNLIAQVAHQANTSDISIYVKLFAPNGVLIRDQYVESPYLITGQIEYYQANLTHQIVIEGLYTIELYLYYDHDGMNDDLVVKYTYKFRTDPSASNFSGMWAFLLPLLLIVMISVGGCVSKEGISLSIFLVLFGTGMLVFIYNGLFPWWMIIFPILLLVIMFFWKDSNE